MKDKISKKVSEIKINTQRGSSGFSLAEKEYIQSKKSPIKPNIDNEIGRGRSGIVYPVRDNDDLIMKIPRGIEREATTFSMVARGQKYDRSNMGMRTLFSRRAIEDEGKFAEKYKSVSHFIPTRVIELKLSNPFEPIPMPETNAWHQQDITKSINERPYYALLRPKIVPIMDFAHRDRNRGSQLSRSIIEQIRRKVTEITWLGFEIIDGIQIGRDREGKLYFYDLEGFREYDINDQKKRLKAFANNNKQWFEFLYYMGLVDTKDMKCDSAKEALKKYGKIQQRS